jgi:hypothetical protein
MAITAWDVERTAENVGPAGASLRREHTQADRVCVTGEEAAVVT